MSETFEHYRDYVEDVKLSTSGPALDTLLDANRLASRRMPESLRGWDLFSVACRGEHQRMHSVREMAVAVALSGNWGRKGLSDELVALGAWVGLYNLVNPADRISPLYLAKLSGVKKEALERVADGTEIFLRHVLHVYDFELTSAIHRVLYRERESGTFAVCVRE